jgi:hypothetical protein
VRTRRRDEEKNRWRLVLDRGMEGIEEQGCREEIMDVSWAKEESVAAMENK